MCSRVHRQQNGFGFCFWFRLNLALPLFWFSIVPHPISWGFVNYTLLMDQSNNTTIIYKLVLWTKSPSVFRLLQTQLKLCFCHIHYLYGAPGTENHRNQQSQSELACACSAILHPVFFRFVQQDFAVAARFVERVQQGPDSSSKCNSGIHSNVRTERRISTR